MEFGGFDDDLFSEPEKKPRKAATVDYKPKTLAPQWFTDDEAIPQDAADQVHLYIFRGNRHYYRGEWSSALDAYTSAMDTVASNNTGMRRLLLESIARCRWRCGDALGAFEMGEMLVAESTNDHQIFGAQSALAMFYEAARNTEGQAKSLKCCLDIRPLSAQHWLQLAKLHLKQRRPKDSRKMLTCHASENGVETKRHREHCREKTSSNLVESGCVLGRTKIDSFVNEDLRGSSIQDSSVHYSNAQIPNAIENADNENAVSTKEELRYSTHIDSREHSFDSSRRNVELKNLTNDKEYSTQNDFRTSSPKYPITKNCDSHMLNVTKQHIDLITNFNTQNAGTIVGNSQDAELQDGMNSDSLRISSAPIDGGHGLEDLSLWDETPTSVKDPGGGGYQAEDLSHLEMEAVKCLLKAKVILKSLQICAISITKVRNAHLLAEIDGHLSSLKLDPDFTEEMSKEMYNVVFAKEPKEEIGTSS